MSDADRKLVGSDSVSTHRCGLRAGDRVALRRDLIVRDPQGNPTGTVYPSGEVWTVLHGAEDDPGTLWLRQGDGERHTWDDDLEVFDWFVRV